LTPTLDNTQIAGESYQSADGDIAVILCSMGDKSHTLTSEKGKVFSGTLLPENVDVIELK